VGELEGWERIVEECGNGLVRGLGRELDWFGGMEVLMGLVGGTEVLIGLGGIG
jgi:hypothetical protein